MVTNLLPAKFFVRFEEGRALLQKKTHNEKENFTNTNLSYKIHFCISVYWMKYYAEWLKKDCTLSLSFSFAFSSCKCLLNGFLFLCRKTHFLANKNPKTQLYFSFLIISFKPDVFLSLSYSDSYRFLQVRFASLSSQTLYQQTEDVPFYFNTKNPNSTMQQYFVAKLSLPSSSSPHVCSCCGRADTFTVETMFHWSVYCWLYLCIGDVGCD